MIEGTMADEARREAFDKLGCCLRGTDLRLAMAYFFKGYAAGASEMRETVEVILRRLTTGNEGFIDVPTNQIIAEIRVAELRDFADDPPRKVK